MMQHARSGMQDASSHILHPEGGRTSSQAVQITDPTIIPAGLTKPVGETLPHALERIAQSLHPERIIIFGSYAYGRPTPDSDVDLLVIMHTNLPPLERYLQVSRLLSPRPFPVDIIVKTPDEIEAALARNDPFLSWIVTRGVTVYDR